MLTLNDGRSELWQWDTGRTLSVDADCSQVHFSNKVFGRSIDVDVSDGVAVIPDILLQTDKDLNVWAFVGTAENGYTKISKTFKVNRRNKPADYVFTPVEQTTIAEIAAIAQSVRDDANAGLFDGKPGENGRDGVDGKDGAPGKDGTSATHSWNGTVLTITSASGTSSSDLKGDKGDKGNTGPAGKDGVPGADGHTPEYGVDYGTPEQIAEIANQAAEILQPDVNQLKEDLANKVQKSDYAPEAKTDAMTQPVGKDSDGKLWTAPGSGGGGIAVSGATVGQTIKISAVDDDGVPTAWEPVDLPSGGAENDNDWEIINTITFEEEGITSFTIDKDQNGNQFELSDMLIRSNYHESLGGTSDISARTNFMINGKITTYSMGNISSSIRYWAAIATLINGRVYYGHSDFLSKSNGNIPLSIRPMQSNLGALYNDNAITSVGINIFNPGSEYFAVGYEITLWGRRKK